MSRKTILIIACASFFAMGWLSASLGPALEDLADHTSSSLAAIGAIFMVGFIGGMPAQGIAGVVSDRLGQRSLIMLGVVVLGLMDIGMALSPNYWLLLVFAVAAGLGFASLEIGYNILIGELYPERVNAMNLAHLFFGLGAVSSPAFASLTLRWFDTAITGILVGVVMMLLSFPFVYRMPRGVIRRASEHEPGTAGHRPAGPFSYRAPLLWLLGGMMLLYVGIEMGTANWTPVYLERSTSMSADTAALGLSMYWLALSGSRLLMATIGDRFTPRHVLWICSIGSVAGGLLLAISTGHMVLSLAATLLCGFSFGPIYPTVVLVVMGVFRNGPGKATSVVSMLGGMGGGLMPWMQGILLERVSPAASVMFVGTGAVLMLTLWLVASQRMAQPTAEPAAQPIPAR